MPLVAKKVFTDWKNTGGYDLARQNYVFPSPTVFESNSSNNTVNKNDISGSSNLAEEA